MSPLDRFTARINAWEREHGRVHHAARVRYHAARARYHSAANDMLLGGGKGNRRAQERPKPRPKLPGAKPMYQLRRVPQSMRRFSSARINIYTYDEGIPLEDVIYEGKQSYINLKDYHIIYIVSNNIPGHANIVKVGKARDGLSRLKDYIHMYGRYDVKGSGANLYFVATIPKIRTRETEEIPKFWVDIIERRILAKLRQDVRIENMVDMGREKFRGNILYIVDKVRKLVGNKDILKRKVYVGRFSPRARNSECKSALKKVEEYCD